MYLPEKVANDVNHTAVAHINQKDIVSEYVPAIPHVAPKINPKISVPKKKRIVNGTIEINVNVSIVLDKIGVMGLCLCIASEERL